MNTVQATAQETDRAQLASRFHALSDVTRLAILESLRGGECCVCDLQNSLDAAQSRLSFHLRVLKDAGLISQRKDGRWSWYQITPGVLDELSAAVRAIEHPPRRELMLYPFSDSVNGSLLRDVSAEADASGCCG